MAVKFSIDFHGRYPASEYVRMAKMAENLGFDEVHVVDDLGFKPAWPLLALIAHNTSRVKLGPWLVTPRIVHPAYHAASLAELDEISDGRAVFCIGRGGFMDQLGLAEPAKPLTMLRESIQLTRHLLRGEKTPFKGTLFETREGMELRWEVRRAEIPLLIGTWGTQTSRMAGEFADGFLASCLADAKYFRTLVEHFDAGAETAARKPRHLEKAVSPLCSISRNRELAFELMRRKLPSLLQYMHPLTEHAGIDPASIPREPYKFEATIRNVPVTDRGLTMTEAEIRFFSTAGTPADIIPQVEALIDAGANHIAFCGPLGPDIDEAITLLATEVVPRFR